MHFVVYIFFKIKFLEEFFHNTISVKSLDLDQALHFVRPNLGPYYLQMLSTEDTGRPRVGVCLLLSILYVPVNNISVTVGWVFQG